MKKPTTTAVVFGDGPRLWSANETRNRMARTSAMPTVPATFQCTFSNVMQKNVAKKKKSVARVRLITRGSTSTAAALTSPKALEECRRPIRHAARHDALVERELGLDDGELRVELDELLSRRLRVVPVPVIAAARRTGKALHDPVHRHDVRARRDETGIGLELGKDVLLRMVGVEDDQHLLPGRDLVAHALHDRGILRVPLDQRHERGQPMPLERLTVVGAYLDVHADDAAAAHCMQKGRVEDERPA